MTAIHNLHLFLLFVSLCYSCCQEMELQTANVRRFMESTLQEKAPQRQHSSLLFVSL